MKTYNIADTVYDKETAEQLRQQVIEHRDSALRKGEMSKAVALSHVVAFMSVAIEEMYREPDSGQQQGVRPIQRGGGKKNPGKRTSGKKV